MAEIEQFPQREPNIRISEALNLDLKSLENDIKDYLQGAKDISRVMIDYHDFRKDEGNEFIEIALIVNGIVIRSRINKGEGDEESNLLILEKIDDLYNSKDKVKENQGRIYERLVGILGSIIGGAVGAGVVKIIEMSPKIRALLGL